MKAKRTSALVRSELEVQDRETRKVKHHDARHARRKTNHHTSVDAPFATVKTSNGITLSMGFQTVRVDVGVELPWPCRPGRDGLDDLKLGFDAAYQFIDDELAARAKEIEPLLVKLAKKYRGQR